MRYQLKQLANLLNVKLQGDGDIFINTVASIDQASEGDISFVSNSKYSKQLSKTRASAVIITEEMLEITPVSALVVDTLVRLMQGW